MMHVGAFSAHLALGSELVDWYRNSLLVPHRQLLMDLWPCTDDITFLNKQKNRPIKILQPGQVETYNVFGR